MQRAFAEAKAALGVPHQIAGSNIRTATAGGRSMGVSISGLSAWIRLCDYLMGRDGTWLAAPLRVGF